MPIFFLAAVWLLSTRTAGPCPDEMPEFRAFLHNARTLPNKGHDFLFFLQFLSRAPLTRSQKAVAAATVSRACVSQHVTEIGVLIFFKLLPLNLQFPISSHPFSV
jgi:hypothetical protein